MVKRDELQRMSPLFAVPRPTQKWQPAADVYRVAEGWLLKIELAGVRQDEFELRLSGRQLVLTGRRRDWQIRDRGQCQSLEITYDEFERRFDFPIDLSQAHISTDYEQGMLIVRITPPGGTR
jgi:HSP20 family protein